MTGLLALPFAAALSGGGAPPPAPLAGRQPLAPVRAALSRHDDRTRLLALLSPT